MFNKKILILSIFLILSFTISAVSAENNDTSDFINQKDVNDEIVNYDIDINNYELKNPHSNIEANNCSPYDLNECKEILSSDENEPDYLSENNADILNDPIRYYSYTVYVDYVDMNYGKSNSIKLTVVSAANNYDYRYDFYLKIYDSHGVEKISKRYVANTVSQYVLTQYYNIGPTSLNPGIYTVKVINTYDNSVMRTSNLNVLSVPYSAYPVSVKDTNINQGFNEPIYMTISPASSNYYYKYDFYLKIYDSNGIEKISKRYYSNQASNSLTYTIGDNTLDSGVYTIKIVNNYDNKIMSTARLSLNPPSSAAYSVIVNDINMNYGSSALL